MKTTFTILFILIARMITAQLPYNLSVSSQNFQYLTGGTALSGSASQTVSLPFPFVMSIIETADRTYRRKIVRR